MKSTLYTLKLFLALSMNNIQKWGKAVKKIDFTSCSMFQPRTNNKGVRARGKNST
jgi:hypothetical protein